MMTRQSPICVLNMRCYVIEGTTCGGRIENKKNISDSIIANIGLEQSINIEVYLY